MANTFTISSDKYEGRYLRLDCSQVMDIDSNTSTINWTLVSTGGDDNYYSTGPTTVLINGHTVYNAQRKAWNSYEFPAATGSVSGSTKVSHDTQGKATIQVVLATAIYTTTTKNYIGSWVLDTIPRKATLTKAPDFNDELIPGPTIEYTNPLGTNATKLQACISLTGSKDDIVYRDIPKDGTSYTFTLKEEERNVLRAATTGSNTRRIAFFIRTTIGTTNYHHSLYRNFTVVNQMPTLSPSIYDTGGVSTKLTGNANTMIRYFNEMNYSIGAAAPKQGQITSQSVSYGGKTATAASGSLGYVDTNVFTFSATDNRGNTVSKTITVPMVEYVPLTCSVDGRIALSEADSTKASIGFTVSGNYFNGSFGAVENTLTLYYALKNGSKTTIASGYLDTSKITYSNGIYNIEHTFSSNYDYKDSYTIELTATDKIYSVNGVSKTLKAIPIFDWGENDFNFNVPISFNGQEMKDFIVEQGTSGIWTYRKWNSGIAECWGTIAPAAHSITNAWGAIYTKDNAIGRQSYPFQFTDDPVVSMTLHNPTGNCWAYTGTPGGVSQSPAFGLARGTSGSATVGARIMAIGKWR